MTQILRNKKGVTLVELLAVIVILGIIAAIAVPTIGGLISRQQANADRVSFASIEEQARLYAIDESVGQFTMDDIITYGFELGDNELSLDGSTPIVDFTVIVIKVSGSTVTFHHLTETALHVNGTNVATMTAP